MRLRTHSLAISLMVLIGLCPSVVAQADRTTPVPCLDTTSNPSSDTRLRIQPVGADAAQEVSGKLTSWDARTRTFRFHSDLTGREESIEVRSLTFELSLGNPIAQQPLRSAEPIGEISRRYDTTEISIADGVLNFPGCTRTHRDSPIGFRGEVKFGRSKVELEGEVFEIKPPQGGPSNSTAPKIG